tara:strand:+ start:1641 stop:2240 length:600 start_codon:yes stop_codon:yes gene_type:complete
MENFILTENIDEFVCKKLIEVFERNPKHQYSGKVIDGENEKPDYVDSDVKKSIDMNMVDVHHPVIDDYFRELQKVLTKYKEKYPEVDILPYFAPTHFKMQKYDLEGHFNSWHFERHGSYSRNRCLVYMTYLNTVDKGGETYFKYQDIKMKPEIGKTVIWPSDWTHTHKGVSPESGYKYIATGWYTHICDHYQVQTVQHK